MSLLVGYQTNKAIATLLAHEGSTPEGKHAVTKLKKIGSPAIPKLISALASTQNSMIIENLLGSLLNASTLPLFITALTNDNDNDNDNIVNGITRVLAKAKEINTSLLLDQFTNPNISKKALGEILLSHYNQINASSLLALLDKVSSNVRPVIYKILDKAVNEKSIESLIYKAKSPEPLVRTHIATLLSRFNKPESISTLIGMLQDDNKTVRQTALKGLASLKAASAVQAICQLLRDPDLLVQTVAIDSLVKIRGADTVKYLITILQDESEYVRRAAVEVLNEVGDQRAIKDLLNALRDADWWVKVRAADALGSIGGPKVIDAVLLLINDNDEFMRRTAVEILNTSNDQRAFGKLVEALKDNDWWVRERAVDALASLGDKRAIEPLAAMLDSNPEANQIIIKALATLGDTRAIKPLLSQLNNKNNDSAKETLRALSELTDEYHAQDVQNAITTLLDTTSNTGVSMIAKETMKTLIDKFGRKAQGKSALNPDQPEESQSLLVDFGELRRRSIIDATKLRADDVFANRYKVIRHIGKGAFGVVVLVEDMVVRDQFILKFLNPHFAADSEMIKRFTQELRYARKVTHENIIRIYDLVNHDDSYAISMEYFPSHSLADELKNDARIPIKRGVTLLDEIFSGLSAAEQVNVVHRDLKPSNILINENDIVKIVDFGLAAAASSADSRLTKTGILVGTPTYMAPEQVKGKTIDSKTDIYSMGIIMYEMFTGTAPYKAEGSLAIMYQHVEGKAKPPRELNPDIPLVLQKLIQKAMATDPDDRFSSFKELRHELHSVAREVS